jgi:LuxR family maltose regulon positive regulatory protein
MLAEILYLQGNLEHAAQLCKQLMEEAVGEESMLDDQGEARRILANVLYEQNDLEAAARYATEAIEMARQRSNELLEAQAQGRLSAVHLALGQGSQALAELLALTVRLNHPLAQREALDAHAWLAACVGEWESLANWHATRGDGSLLYPQRQRQLFLLVRLMTHQGRTDKALALLESLPTGVERSLAQALILQALARRAAGDVTGASESLTKALEIGQEKGFRRLFLDEGEPLAALLRELLPAHLPTSLSLYAATLLRLFPLTAAPTRRGSPVAGALVEPLSGQELRVLRLLAAGMSNGEIANELVVSTNTVKTHVKNIYRKLNVNARDEARALAKELKLI